MKKIQTLLLLVLTLSTPLALAAGSANPLSKDFEGTIIREGETINFKGIKSFEIRKGDVVKIIKGSIQLSYKGCPHLSLNKGQMVQIAVGKCGIPFPVPGGAAISAGGFTTTGMVFGTLVAGGLIKNATDNDNAPVSINN